MRIAAFVYTYNRRELLARCLESLLNQTRPLDEIIVVDTGSTDGTEQLLREKFPDIAHVRLPEDLGGAGGVHAGIKLAYEKGHDWVWIMDDDALPLPNALEELVNVITGGQIPIDTVGALVSRRVWPVDKLDPTIPRARIEIIDGTAFAGHPLPPRQLQRTSSLQNVKSVGCALFSGMLVRRKAIECVGLPLREFFIFWDDVEYSERLINHGFDLYQVSSSYVIHRLWKPYKTMRLLLRTVSIEAYPDWQSYYLVRNVILMFKAQRHSYGLYYTLLRISKFVLLRVPAEIVIRLLLKDTGKIKFVLKGVIDGLSGKAGKRSISR